MNTHAYNRNRNRSNRGFTIVELIVVITVIAFLAAMAVGAYNKVVNDAKIAKSTALVSTLATAKAMFAADPNTTATQITSFNSGQGDAQFNMIAPFVRVNGEQPTTVATLLQLSGMPASVAVSLGTLEDSTNGVQDSAPTVTGWAN